MAYAAQSQGGSTMHLSNALRKKSPWIVRTAILTLVMFCTVLTLSQSVFAKNTYVISDGTQVTVHTTFETDPYNVLMEAGVELDHIDTYTIASGSGRSEITVQRGQRLTIDLFGEILQVVSYNETVGQLLERLTLDLGENAHLSISADAMASEGMVLEIFTTDIGTDTYTAEIPFETVYQNTEYLPAGKEVILTQGVNGTKLCVAELNLVNGIEKSRVVISEEVTQAPVTQIVAVGTGNGKPKSGAPLIGDGVIITPQGKVLNFGSVGVFEATAYMTMPPYTYETTATGTKVHVGTVAVDPTVIPYGTKMYIVSCDGKIVYGEGTAEDCGPAIKNDRIDVFYHTFAECSIFARRDCYVYFLTD